MRQLLANIVKRSIAHGTKKHQYFWVIETFSTDSIAADQERQTMRSRDFEKPLAWMRSKILKEPPGCLASALMRLLGL